MAAKDDRIAALIADNTVLKRDLQYAQSYTKTLESLLAAHREFINQLLTPKHDARVDLETR